ncbi:beta-lactamase/transpeptidase-like protein [Corynespora cassiicola Philippines]|uniref:Beta-lactamase/transpeptidase-like protein n=1 Tax=Corynespora cassiicola Philippines TaxID=1448308 RepID=A0A2T2NZS4_CORCC|nr:beta-lactamase/transpeptidase-like protein [Corynespora cassiicola Philippines]
MSHDDLEQVIEQKIADSDIAGAVLIAANRDGTFPPQLLPSQPSNRCLGSFTYDRALGKNAPGGTEPLTPSSIMWIASCTKLMTSISALQLVERGIVTLDEPVYKHIPELKSLPVIKGFNDDGSPIEEPHQNPITLRLLLTHASGITYDGLHPSSIAWLKYHKKEPGTAGTVLGRFSGPLVFEPGTSWMYGAGIDWAGLLIERATGKTLEEYFRENIWEPLGIKDMTFHLSKRPDLAARFAKMSWRDEETKKIREMTDRVPYTDGEGKEVVDCMGGQGIFTSPEEYIKVVHGLLTTEEDERLLKKETVTEFFKPQLGEGSIAALNQVLSDRWANDAMGGTPMNIRKDWGLGGVLIEDDIEESMKKWTMIWGGLPNLLWFVDRTAGLCGLYASQLLPTGDVITADLVRKFEAAVYERYAKSRNVSSRI